MTPRFVVHTALVLFATLVEGRAIEEAEIAKLYRAGVAGDHLAVERCIGELEAVVAAQPKNQLAQVYLGSAYTLRSRDLGIGSRKLQVLKDGLAKMDRAVIADPKDSRVRLVRAMTTDALPFFIGRRAEAAQDFQRLAEEAHARPQGFSEGDLQMIYFFAGNAAKARGDRPAAVKLWNESTEHPGDPRLGEKARALLAREK